MRARDNGKEQNMEEFHICFFSYKPAIINNFQRHKHIINKQIDELIQHIYTNIKNIHTYIYI